MLKSPKGCKIVGTLETVEGVACFVDGKIVNGKIEFEYDGETEIDWDSQKPMLTDDTKERIFVDELGCCWSESVVIKATEKAGAKKK